MHRLLLKPMARQEVVPHRIHKVARDGASNRKGKVIHPIVRVPGHTPAAEK